MKKQITVGKSVTQSGFVSFAAAIAAFTLLFGLILGPLAAPRSLANDIDTVLSARPAAVSAPTVVAMAHR